MFERLEGLPLILVSGQARSGTTILTRAIAAHPQVLSNGRENVWLRDIMAVVGETVGNQSRTRQLAISPDDFATAFRRTALQVLFPNTTVPDDIAGIRALSTFSSLRQEMFDSLPIFWPHYYLLNIVRNGIEVVASRLKHQHIASAGDFETHCIAWAHSIDVVRWFAERADLQSRFFLVRHEQLLDSDQCKDLFANIQLRFGLEPANECATFVTENHVSKNPDFDSQQSPQTGEGIQARQNAWKQWTPEQRKSFKSICGEAMKELDYEIPW